MRFILRHRQCDQVLSSCVRSPINAFGVVRRCRENGGESTVMRGQEVTQVCLTIWLICICCLFVEKGVEHANENGLKPFSDTKEAQLEGEN